MVSAQELDHTVVALAVVADTYTSFVQITVARWRHHLRQYNRMADKLANIAMDTGRSIQLLGRDMRSLLPIWKEVTDNLRGNLGHWQEGNWMEAGHAHTEDENPSSQLPSLAKLSISYKEKAKRRPNVYRLRPSSVTRPDVISINLPSITDSYHFKPAEADRRVRSGTRNDTASAAFFERLRRRKVSYPD